MHTLNRDIQILEKNKKYQARKMPANCGMLCAFLLPDDKKEAADCNKNPFYQKTLFFSFRIDV